MSGIVRLVARRAGAVDDVGVPLRLVAVTAVVALIGLTLRSHEMWYDELRAWALVSEADSLVEVAGSLRYEGHPIGWYVPLWFLSRVTGDPDAMQLVQLVVATATTWVLVMRTPFRFVVQLGLALSNAFAYEYLALSRSYGMTLLFVLLATDALARAQPRRGLAAGWLVAASFTHLLGAALAVAVVGGLAVDGWRRRRRTAARSPGLGAAAVVLLGAALAVASAWPAPGGRRASRLLDAPVFGGRSQRLVGAVSASLEGMAPVPTVPVRWGATIWAQVPGPLAVLAGVGLAVLVAAALWRWATARWVWISGWVVLTSFFLVAYPPKGLRHTGFLLVLLVVALWFAVVEDRAAGPGPAGPVPAWLSKLGSLAVLAVLAVQVATGVVRSVDDWRSTFSGIEDVAALVDEAGLRDRLVSPDPASGVAVVLDVQTRSLLTGRSERYVRLEGEALAAFRSIDYEEAVARAQAVATCDGEPVALLWRGAGLRDDQPPGVRALSTGVVVVEPVPDGGSDPCPPAWVVDDAG